jgi:RNA polymerase sigma factor (sigma-70 family)
MTVTTMAEAGLAERSGQDRVADEESGVDVGRLFDAHRARLFRLARRLSRNREEACDLVQETFLRAARAPERIPPGPTSEEAWLVRVLVNLFRDSWRRTSVRSRYQATLAPGGEGNPESAYVVRLAVQAALARLDARRRAIVVLHELEGESAEAIARLLGVTAVTVRWHLFRARKELAGMLAAQKAGE